MGINQFQFMQETKTLLADQRRALNPSLRIEVKLEPQKTVQLHVDYDALKDTTGESLDRYLKTVEFKIGEVAFTPARAPFATARKFLTMQEHRLTAILRAVKNVRKMPQQHGSYVNNLPPASPDNEEAAKGNPSTQDQTIPYQGVQYFQLPLPKQTNEINKDRQSEDRGGNNR